MRRYIKLSYDIHEGMPVYPGTEVPVISKDKQIKNGDSCNTYSLRLSNHTGTHIDAPRHFFDNGQAIADYELNELVFKRPYLLDCPKDEGEAISVEDLSDRESLTECDLLLLRTGFQNKRQSDPDCYMHKGPFISPLAAEWIRKNLPNIRCIGIDCLSVSSYTERGLGKDTHQILLTDKQFSAPAVLILEDLRIPDEAGEADEIICLPLFISGVDSAPCTVIGVFYD